MSSDLLTAVDVAHRLKVPVDSVYNWARDNILPSVRIGRTLRFDPDKIEEFIASGGKGHEGGWKKL